MDPLDRRRKRPHGVGPFGTPGKRQAGAPGGATRARIVDQAQDRLGGRVGIGGVNERRKPGGPKGRGDLVPRATLSPVVQASLSTVANDAAVTVVVSAAS
jgi:hypothetical protein